MFVYLSVSLSRCLRHLAVRAVAVRHQNLHRFRRSQRLLRQDQSPRLSATTQSNEISCTAENADKQWETNLSNCADMNFRKVLIFVNLTQSCTGFIARKSSQESVTTSTLSQRKGRAPQPSVTWGGGSQPGGVLHNNNSDMTP